MQSFEGRAYTKKPACSIGPNSPGPHGLLQEESSVQIPIACPKQSAERQNPNKYKIWWQRFIYRKCQEDLYGKKFALQQHVLIQILLVFLRFKLLPNFIFQCYRPQTWQFYLFFPALSVSSIHEVLGTIKFKGVGGDPHT